MEIEGSSEVAVEGSNGAGEEAWVTRYIVATVLVAVGAMSGGWRAEGVLAEFSANGACLQVTMEPAGAHH